MSQGLCSGYCKKNNFAYSITTSGSTCHCSNEFDLKNKVDDSKCNTPCVGYPLETCGSNILDSNGEGSRSGGYANIMFFNIQSSSSPSSSSKPISRPDPTTETGNGQEHSSISQPDSLSKDPVNIAGTEILITRSGKGSDDYSDEDEGEDEDDDEDSQGSGDNSEGDDDVTEDEDESGDRDEDTKTDDSSKPTNEQ
ncbi:hypothetical protein BGZ76_006752, partial [Entomortierella beljakovae]